MMKRAKGATLIEIMEVTSWQRQLCRLTSATRGAVLPGGGNTAVFPGGPANGRIAHLRLTVGDVTDPSRHWDRQRVGRTQRLRNDSSDSHLRDADFIRPISARSTVVAR